MARWHALNPSPAREAVAAATHRLPTHTPPAQAPSSSAPSVTAAPPTPPAPAPQGVKTHCRECGKVLSWSVLCTIASPGSHVPWQLALQNGAPMHICHSRQQLPQPILEAVWLGAQLQPQANARKTGSECWSGRLEAKE